MTRKSPAFSFYPDSWFGGTLRFTPIQRAAYIDLLCAQWLGGPFTFATALLAARGVLVDDIQHVLDEKFEKDGSIYWNARLEEERQKQSAKRESGRLGGSKTQAKGVAKRKRNASKRPSESLHSVSVSVSDSISDTEKNSAAAQLVSFFDRFWKSYPKVRKRGKAKARAAFEKAAKRGIDPEVMISAASEYAASQLGASDFSMMPATWLNGECWEDDREAWNRSTTEMTTKQRQHKAMTDEMTEFLGRDENGQGGVSKRTRIGVDIHSKRAGAGDV